MDLELIPTSDLIKELQKRHHGFLLVTAKYEKPINASEQGIEHFKINFGGGVTLALGLALRAILRMFPVILTNVANQGEFD